MHPETNFNEINLSEAHPSPINGEGVNIGEVVDGEHIMPKKNISEELSKRFEKIADVVVNKEKLMNVTEFNESAVIFQQDVIKDILAIKDDNPKKAAAQADKYWEEYDNMVGGYAGRFKSEEEKKKIIKEFGFYKTSVLGSLAAIRFFEEKGFKVKFPAPDEDVFKQCDLFFERSGKKKNDFNLGVQLKSYSSEAVNAKEGAKKAEKIFLVDRSAISDKERQDSFSKLQAYCVKLHGETGKTYFPIFMEIPVSMDVLKPNANELKKVSLVDNRGFLKPGQLKPTMDALWKGYDQLLTKRNK